MKIIESEVKISETLRTWLTTLTAQDPSTFLHSITSYTLWEFEDLEDLAALAPLLNKIDSLLLTFHSNPTALNSLLTFSLKILPVAYSKSLYNSTGELVSLLDTSSWETCKYILKLLSTVLPDIKPEKLEIGVVSALDYKVFAIFVCGFVDKSFQMSLLKLKNSEVPESSQTVPEIFVNDQASSEFYTEVVKRFNWGLRETDRNDLVCCKILAAQVFVALNRLKVFFEMCAGCEQENWMFGAIEEVVNSNMSSEISAECMRLIGKLVKDVKEQKKIRWPTSFAVNIQEQVRIWSKLVVQILNSVSSQNSFYPENDDFLLSVLDLIPMASRLIYAEHNQDYQVFTVSLINLIQKSFVEPRSPFLIYQILKHLVGLLNKSIRFFRDNDGLTVLINLLKSLVVSQLESQIPENLSFVQKSQQTSKLLKNTLKFFKILAERWEEAYNGLEEMTPVLIETGLIESMTAIFKHRLSDFFEDVLSVIFPIMQVNISPEFNRLFFELTSAVLIASNTTFPNTVKQADILARFLCGIPQGNTEMINLIEEFQVLSRIIFVVGTGAVSIQAANISTNISENLQELVISLPECRNQAVTGVINLLKYLISSPESENFSVQVSNTGNILCSLIINNQDIIRKFLDNRVVELIFEVFHLKVKPKGLVNEIYKLNTFFKVVPDGSVPGIFKKIENEIESSLEKFFYFIEAEENYAGSYVEDELYGQVLTVDCYIDALRTVLQKNVNLPVNFKEFADLLVKLAAIQRFLIKKQAQKLRVAESQTTNFVSIADVSVVENQDLKTPEENWLFMCQLSIRKLFRAAIKVPVNRGKQDAILDYCLNIGKVIGSILTDYLKSIVFGSMNYTIVYYYSLLLSDFIKIMYNEQNPSSLFLLGFMMEDGITHLTVLLTDLQIFSRTVKSSPPYDSQLVNALQILWSLCGKTLENFVSEKFTNFNLGPNILKVFGYNTSRDVVKKMKETVVQCLGVVGYLDAGEFSSSFAKSVLAILKYLTSSTKETLAVDPSCLNMLVGMGFSRQVARQALIAVRRNSVETATEWIFAHPESMNSQVDDFSEESLLTERIYDQILAAIPIIPTLSPLIADCLFQISISNDQVSQKITTKLVGMIGQIVFMFGGYSGLANIEEQVEKDVNWEQLDAYMEVLQIMCVKNLQVFEYLKKISFALHGFRILMEVPVERLADKWVLHLLILLEYVGRTGQEGCEEIVTVLVELLKKHNACVVFGVKGLEALIKILGNYVQQLRFVEIFVSAGGVSELFLLKSCKDNCESISQNKIWSKLLIRLIKDPHTLFKCFQSKILKKLEKFKKLTELLKDCKKSITRSDELFIAALRSVSNITKQNGFLTLSPKSLPDSPTLPKWSSLFTICECLSELFFCDTHHQKKYILNSNNLLEFISLSIDSCPLLAHSLVEVSFSVFCPFSNSAVSANFIENLVRVIIPFRYSLNFKNMSFFIPGTEVQLPQASAENWINICVKLLAQIFLHRKVKYVEKVVNEQLSLESALASTSELFLSIIVNSTEIGWHQSDHKKTINSIIPVILTNLLLLPCPNEKKPSCNCLVFARTLSSPSSNLLSSLLTSFKSLPPPSCKPLLKNLLKLTELLLRYDLNSTLQNNENWELLRSSDFILFKEHFTQNEPIPAESESPAGDLEESPNLLTELSGDEGFISLRNSERGNEREIFETNLPQPPNRLFSSSLFEEGMSRGAFLMSLEENRMFDLYINSRTRPVVNSEPVPDRPIRRVFVENSEIVQKFVQDLMESAMDAVESQEKVNADVVEREIDPDFLAALPDDIRNEVLASHIRSEEAEQGLLFRSGEIETADFMNSLSSNLRREILETATEDVINTLPEDLANEAYLLQERQRIRPRAQQALHEVRKNNPTGFEVFEQIEKLQDRASNLYQPDAEVLLSLFKGFVEGLLCPKLFSLCVLSLSAHPQSLEDITKALILLIVDSQKKFQFDKKSSKETTENSSNTLLFLTKFNQKAKKILAYERFSLFQQVIELTDSEFFISRPTSLSVLLKIISRVLKSAEGSRLKLSPETLSKLTTVLKLENLSEKSLKKLAKILNVIAQHPEVKENLLMELGNSLFTIEQEIQEKLNQDQILSITKESQVFRLCEVIKNVSGTCEVVESLWIPLADCIAKLPSPSALEDQCLKKLLPLIQAFFVSHTGQELSKVFWYFSETCSKHLNRFVHKNFDLLETSLKTLINDFSFLLDFENKRQYFTEKIREQKRGKMHGSLRLNVRRTDVFTDSFHQLKGKTPEEMQSKLRVQFAKEDGIDAGGLAREWFGLLSREMFNPNYALFIPSANGVTFQPNSMSHINQDHLQFFKFVGRIVGKAISDGFTLDVYFTRSFYKHILGQEISYQDMEDIDVGFYKNLKSLVDINLMDNDLHEYYFMYEEQEFGSVTVKELVPGGKEIRVTEGNKLEYIKLLCHMKMTKNIQAQIQAFKTGFYEIISPKLISIFSSKELELLISGLPTFDVDDLKKNTEYYNYNKDSQVIVWFWRVLQEFSEEEKAEFLQFVTGSSKVPIEGFKALPGMDGPQKFQIHKSFASKERLPTAHTCINQLDLPEYSSEEELKNKLMLAIREGNEGFGFA